MNAEVLVRNLVTVSNSRAVKSPALGFLHLFSQFSSPLPSPSNPPAQEAAEPYLQKPRAAGSSSVCPKDFFPARLVLSSLAFPQLQNSSLFQRFLSPLIPEFLRAGVKSWNVWGANQPALIKHHPQECQDDDFIREIIMSFVVHLLNTNREWDLVRFGAGMFQNKSRG